MISYTIAVWSERFAGRLEAWHLAFFWLGLATDTAGTSLMGVLAGGFAFNLHSVTGALALVLMLVHTVWATVVLVRRDEEALLSFHKFSTFVWLVWLVPFISGMIMARAA